MPEGMPNMGGGSVADWLKAEWAKSPPKMIMGQNSKEGKAYQAALNNMSPDAYGSLLDRAFGSISHPAAGGGIGGGGGGGGGGGMGGPPGPVVDFPPGPVVPFPPSGTGFPSSAGAAPPPQQQGFSPALMQAMMGGGMPPQSSPQSNAQQPQGPIPGMAGMAGMGGGGIQALMQALGRGGAGSGRPSYMIG